MIDHAVTENGWRYWWALIRSATRRHDTWPARMRALAHTIGFGYYGELCRRCGRPYLLWWNYSDELWTAVMGGPGGLLCPCCFTVAAADIGIGLQWVPHRFPAASPGGACDSNSMTESHLTCPSCGASIRAQMAEPAAASPGETPQ